MLKLPNLKLYENTKLQKNMKYLLFLPFFLFISCDIQKQSQKSKIDTNLKTSEEIHTFRKGDTVSIRVPKITYKDTTIYTTNRQGTTLQTIYDKQGNISNIDCYASQIEELTKRNSELEQSDKEKQSSKVEKANMDWVLYIVIGAVIIVLIGLFLVLRQLKGHAEIIKAIVDKV